MAEWKIDIFALCLFLLALGQSMTGVGSDYAGFAMFYAVGLILLMKVINGPCVKKEVPGMLRFVIIVMLGCVMIGTTFPSADAFVQGKVRREIPVITVHIPPPVFPTVAVLASRQSEPKAKFEFTFLPTGANEGLVNTISKVAENGVISVVLTAKNVGTAQADNGQIWIQICDGCRFAEEPQGTTMPPDDPVVRRKRFDTLHMGSFFEGTPLKIIPP